ncbi:hypothetical protein [Chitiniphilus eburneus]|uniref:hypothetical protein n=1 Tax=Chitiniphilus eburneus TaxID=2571148 RepID=UPI0035CEA821
MAEPIATPAIVDGTAPRAIRVTATCDTFRRAGRAFGREPVEIDLDALSQAELDALLAEPMLVAVFVADVED